jgi:hypothetical protein
MPGLSNYGGYVSKKGLFPNMCEARHEKHTYERHVDEMHAMRDTPMRGTSMRGTPMRGTSMRGRPMKCTLTRNTT